MKNIFLTILIAITTIGATSQTYLTQVKPEGSKFWGYANEEGELIIPAKYKKCFPFSGGFAVVYINKTYSFIKPDGSLLNTKVKDFRLAKSSLFGLQGFSNGMVQVKLGDKWGYLNTEGELVIEAKYDDASFFSQGFAIVKIGEGFLIIDKQGNETPVTISGIKKLKHFSEDLAVFTSLNGKIGFINTKGEVVIDPQFLSTGYFINGVAWAKNESKELGYINKTGEWVIDAKFMAGKNFDPISGLARVKYNDQWAYVTMSGDIKMIKDTDVWGDFNNGLAKGRKDGKLGFFDKTGAFVIEPKFEGVRNFKNGFAAAKLNGKWGMINAKGEWIIQPEYIGIKDMELIP